MGSEAGAWLIVFALAAADRNGGSEDVIRDRRPEDLDRLCAVLRTVDDPLGLLPRDDLTGWLCAHDAEQSWVFDMAPMSVAPTRNVVGHVQVYALDDEAATTYLSAGSRTRAGDLLAIGRLFVKPMKHDYGVGRHLLKAAVRYIRGQGRLPVLDLHDNVFVSQQFAERYGFERVASDDPAVAAMVHAR